MQIIDEHNYLFNICFPDSIIKVLVEFLDIASST